mmetsp:Transcript_11543/g.24168  ORF Transcript_11543/g.24168 Transcript_11543/m.24168 type:complete len:219 (-) Transcript_11543:2369-3025(-)
MMAPLGPAPAMVGKDSSMNPSCCPRTSISFNPTSASVTERPAATSASSQAKNWAIAALSRRCASRIPASSASFFSALASPRGVLLSNTPTGADSAAASTPAFFLPAFLALALAFASIAFFASLAAALAAAWAASASAVLAQAWSAPTTTSADDFPPSAPAAAGSMHILRGVYLSLQLVWLNASPRRSTVTMRSELCAMATMPSGHCSEAKEEAYSSSS